MKRIGLPSALGLATLMLLSSSALANVVKGQNTKLNAWGDKLYVPLLAVTSGTLGDPLSGNQQVGKQPDPLFQLSGVGAASQGYISFGLDWVLQTAMKKDTADILLTMTDLDFSPMSISGASLIEAMELTFLQDPGDTPGATDLTVYSANYGNYRPDGFGPCAGAVTYTFNLKTDLGVSDADLDAINTVGDLDFALMVTLRSRIERVTAGSGSFTNTRETFVGNLDYEPEQVNPPEPGSMAVLALGLVALLRRKRR